MPSDDFCEIEERGPFEVITVESLAALQDQVRRASSGNRAMYPLGGGTMLDIGLPPTKPGLAINLCRLDQVIDFPARDMTITVQAGITFARLQERLATEQQRLPVDVPQPERATLGGALATNVSGPRRYAFGTLRDYVIGITVVNDDGQETKAGGRVVKNVAGYDLPKLHIGALGTLGIITQVTLKVRPLPEAQAMSIAQCAVEALPDLLDRIHASTTRPVCIEVLATPTTREAFQVMIGFEENKQTVAWQVEKLHQELRAGCILEVKRDTDAARAFRDLAEAAPDPAIALSFKANLAPSALAAFLKTARTFDPAFLQAHAGNGIVIGGFTSDLTLERATAMLKVLLDAAVAAKGNLVLLRCPTAWKSTLPVWGKPRGDLELMRAVKERLDPKRIFNPGRFIDGI